MPRLTYCPSRNSSATRRASCSLVSATLGSRFARRHALDAFAAVADGDDALDEDSRGVHVARIDLARLDEFLDLRDRDSPSRRAQRIEVARRLIVDEVAVPVAARCAHEREVGGDPFLEGAVAA